MFRRRKTVGYSVPMSRKLRIEALERRTLLSATNPLLSAAGLPLAVAADGGAGTSSGTLQYYHIVNYAAAGNGSADGTSSSDDSIAAAGSTPDASAGPIGYTPTQLRTAYGVSQLSVGMNGGADQTIAIIDAYDDPSLVSSTHPGTDSAFAASDFGQFDTAMGLPAPPSFLKVNENGATSPLPSASGTSGWSVEESLDVEWAHAMAPAANIILIECSSTLDADLITAPTAALGTAANLAFVSVVSMSFGRSENSTDTTLDPDFSTPAGHTPITYLASTGDSGAPGGYPAYSPNVVAVGGTTLTLGAGNVWASETAWSDGGGGKSSYETEPSYQEATQTSGFREIPDVSSDADPNTGVAVYDSYDYGSATPWEEIGGTSVASPCWAGLISITDQLRTSSGLPTLNGRQDTLPALYNLYKTPSSYMTDFHDITVGSNGNPAGPGYDMATGIGSPQANSLMPDLVGVSNKGIVAFSASSIAIGTSATITVSDLNQLGQPSLTVTMTSSAGDSETLTLTAQGGGVFKGSIPISAGAVVVGDGILETVSGGTITATYADVNWGGLGQTVNVTAQATTYLPVVITSTTPAAGGTFALPGPFTYDVNFNEPVLASSVTTSSLTLSGIAGAAVSAVTMLNGNTTAQFTLSGITTDGAFIASIAAGAITDPSGNPNTAFTATYYVDLGTAAFPAPLASTAPKGSLIYSNTTPQHFINPDGNPGTFTLSVDPNQTITILMTPSGSTLQPSVQLLDPSNAVIATATAAAAGQDALLQTVATDNSTAGTYTIVVSGASSTTGGYTLQATLNAALEREGLIAGATDNTLATAQDLTASFLTLGALGSQAQRGAVVGQTTAASTPDYYSFTASAGDVDTFALENLGTGSLSLALVNSSGTTIATGASGATNVSAVINQFQIAAAGTYYLQVEGAASDPYSLVATRNAAFSLQAHNTLATAQNITGTQGVLGSVNSSGGSTATLTAVNTGWWDDTGSHTSTNTNYIAGVAQAGEWMRDYFVFDLTSVSSTISGAELSLYNPAGDGYDSINPTQTYDTYGVSTPIASLEASGTGQTGIYNALGSGANFSSTTVSAANDGQDILIPLNAAGVSYLNAARGSQAAFGGAVTDYVGTTSTQAIFAYSGTTSLNGLILTYAAPDDYYADQLTAGVAVDLATSTPADGTGEFVNTSSPHLQLYDPSGNLVASGVVGADGRNETINYVPTVSGVYSILVTDKNNTSGEYFLSLGTPIGVAVPANLTQGQGTVNGTISVPTAPTSNLVVSLVSSDPTRLTVPSTVTILAGQTSATFPVTAIADGLLHGPEAVTITATAPGYAGGGATVEVHDNITASLTVTLPQSAHEDAGAVTGTVTASAAPAQNVTIQLSSGTTSQLTVPTTVVLPAGQTSVNFTATLVDDHVIEGGPTPVTVTAQMDNWTPGTTSISVLDDDATLAVSLPASGWEGQTAAGTVTLGGTLTTPLTVYLSSSDTTQLTVPASVTVPAGQTTASFTATLIDNGLRTGPQTETVTATATGLTTGSTTIIVKDADVDHYTFGAIPANEVAGLPFAVTIQACDVLGNPIAVYNGAATLSATGQGGALTVSPTSITFASGVWMGNVTVATVDPSAVLQVAGGDGATGTSTAINVYPQLQATATTPASGGSFTLPGPFNLLVSFNEAVLPASVTTSSLTLSGITGAGVTGVTVLAGNTEAEFTIGGITTVGTLTASVAAGAIDDQYGFPCKAFSGTYYVDLGTAAFSAPLTSQSPAGSLIYSGSDSAGAIEPDGNPDTFTLSVNPGQTISVLVTPSSSTLQPTVELIDPSSTVIGTAAAAAAGQNALIQATATTSATTGTYEIVVGEAGATSGAYTVQVYLNAALQLQRWIAGATDNSIAAAQSINGSFVALPAATTAAERGAVVGQVNSTAAPDYYSFTVAAGETDTLAVTALTSGTVNLELLNAGGVVLANGVSGATNLGAVVGNYSFTTEGTYYAEVTGGSSVPYSLVITRNAAFGTLPNGTAATAQSLSGTAGVLASVQPAATTSNVVVPNADANVGGSSANGYPFNISAFSVASMRYQQLYSASQFVSGGAIEAIAFRRGSGDPTFSTSGIDVRIDLGYAATSPATISTTFANNRGNGMVTVYNGLLSLASSGTGTPNPFDIVINVSPTFTYNPALGNLLMDVFMYNSPSTTYFDADSSNSSVARVWGTSVTATSGSTDGYDYGLITQFRFVPPASQEWYAVKVPIAGSTLNFATSTPSDGPAAFGNTLSPHIQLYNPAGTTLLASGTVGADGRNESLSYKFAAAGTYYVSLSSKNNTQGEYFLSVSQPLALSAPTDLTEGNASTGTVTIAAAQASDLVVNLVSSDPTRLSVPSSVTIPAGQTSATFAVTAINDNLLDGPEQVTIGASGPGSLSAAALVTVHDASTATITVNLPATAHEKAGSVAGTITCSAAPADNITIQLSSGDTALLTVPPTVVLPAGQTSVNFTATLLDDQVITFQPTPITVTPAMDNWPVVPATINIVNDDATLAVSLPASGWKGQTAAGTVTLGGTSTTATTVYLASSDATKLSMPASVTVPAGQTSVGFTATLIDNGLHTGPETESVTATSSGFTSGAASIVIDDSDVDHYTFTTIATPQADGLAFSVTAKAYDVMNNLITVYNSAVPLSAAGQGGALSISPTAATFASGVWTGAVTVNGVDPAAVLMLNNGAGASGSSNSFVVQPGAVASLSWSAVAGPKGINAPFTATLTAKDVNGYTATGFSGTAALTGAVGTLTKASNLGEPTPTTDYNNGTWSLGYTFTPASTITVTDVLHYFGTKISIWTNTGTLVTSQTFAESNPGWIDTPLATPVQLTGGVTYRIADYTAGQNYYVAPNQITTTPLGTIGQECEVSGDGFPTNLYTFSYYCVDIVAQVGTYTNVPIAPATATFANGTWTGNIAVSQAETGMHLHVDDGAGHTADSNTFNVAANATSVVGRYVFYAGSVWDGNEPAPNPNDDASIAPDKTALLPGGTAGFANYTSYSRGINGIMIDVQNLVGTPTAADFTFKVGDNNSPGTWAAAPAPSSITVRSGAGTGGSSRVEIVWPDDAIAKEWLQVTVLADAHTGLTANDVFYFGNAIGDTGNSPTDAYVNATDEILVRNNFTASAAITNDDDFNRDGTVDAGDQAIVRQNVTNFMDALKLISVPAAAAIAAPGDATVTILTASSDATVVGFPTALAAVVSAPGFTGMPTGSVDFIDTSTGADLGLALLDATGRATLAAPALGLGAHGITAVYIGDGTFAGSTSAPLTVTVADAATWTGDAADVNWSDPANWGGMALVTGMPLKFTGAGSSNTNDLADLQVGGIAFPANTGSFDIGGNAVSLVGNIASASAAAQTIALPIVLAAGDANVNVTGAILTIAGDITSSGGAYGIQKTGAGEAVLSGVNNYTGDTAVSGGKLVVTTDTALPTGGNLIVGNAAYFTANSSPDNSPTPVGQTIASAAAAPGAPGPSSAAVASAQATAAQATAAADVPLPMHQNAGGGSASAVVSIPATKAAGRPKPAPSWWLAAAESLQSNNNQWQGGSLPNPKAIDAVLADWM